MRISNTIKNLKYSVLNQIVYTIVNFVMRIVLINTLGIEYLGINGLFSNVLSILSLADLGISNALTFSLYEPLAQQNFTKVKSLTKYFAKVYRVIAFVIFFIGVCLLPIIPNLINGAILFSENVYFIYFLFLMNSVVSYIFIYKQTLLIADQKDYVCVKIQQKLNILKCLISSFLLLVFKNFYLYLLIQIAFTLLTNILISFKSNRLYDYSVEPEADLSLDERKKIIKNTKAVFFHKIGGVVLHGTDNILISMYVGLSTVGIYSNYVLLTGVIGQFINQFFRAMTASVGNLVVSEDLEYSEVMYKRIYYFNVILFMASGIAINCLASLVISFLFGSDLIFSQLIVFFISVSFFINGVRKSSEMFIDGMGLFIHNKYLPLIEAFINLLISFILVQVLGIIGVILGTVISMTMVSLFSEIFILYKYGFKKNFWNRFKVMIVDMITFIVFSNIIFRIMTTIIQNLNNVFLMLLLGSLVAFAFIIILILLYSVKREEFKYFCKIIKNILVKLC